MAISNLIPLYCNCLIIGLLPPPHPICNLLAHFQWFIRWISFLSIHHILLHHRVMIKSKFLSATFKASITCPDLDFSSFFSVVFIQFSCNFKLLIGIFHCSPVLRLIIFSLKFSTPALTSWNTTLFCAFCILWYFFGITYQDLSLPQWEVTFTITCCAPYIVIMQMGRYLYVLLDHLSLLFLGVMPRMQ